MCMILQGSGHGHSHSHSAVRPASPRRLAGPRQASDDVVTVMTTTEQSSNINVQAALIHVIGDLLQSFGVLTAAYIIFYRVCFH